MCCRRCIRSQQQRRHKSKAIFAAPLLQMPGAVADAIGKMYPSASGSVNVREPDVGLAADGGRERGCLVM